MNDILFFKQATWLWKAFKLYNKIRHTVLDVDDAIVSFIAFSQLVYNRQTDRIELCIMPLIPVLCYKNLIKIIQIHLYGNTYPYGILIPSSTFLYNQHLNRPYLPTTIDIRKSNIDSFKQPIKFPDKRIRKKIVQF